MVSLFYNLLSEIGITRADARYLQGDGKVFNLGNKLRLDKFIFTMRWESANNPLFELKQHALEVILKHEAC